MGKLDTALLAALTRPRRAAAERGVTAAPEPINLFVEFTGPVDDLIAVGFRPLAVSRDPVRGRVIASGTMAVEDIPRLEDVEHVVAAEGARPVRPLLNRSVSDAHITPLRDAPYNLTGAGVVIGIIDSIVDPDHRNFRRPDGATRILALWDQTAVPGGPLTPPAGFNFGVEYTENALNAHLDGTNRLDLSKLIPHGTMVAGIAAGNGSQPERCGKPGTYTGVAPEADIISVAMKGGGLTETTHIHQAFTYIWNHPRAANRPIVVNLSQGTVMGPHDGRSALELALDADLQTPRRAVVVAAGNSGAARPHARATVPANDSVRVPISFVDVPTADATLELWHPTNAQLAAQVVDPTGALVPVNDVFEVAPGGGGEVKIVATTGNQNRDASIRVEMQAHDDNTDDSLYIQEGVWHLEVSNDGQAPVTFDCWIEGAVKEDPSFLAGAGVLVDETMTLTTPSTAREVITVGAHSHEGVLAPFSGQGPVRGNQPWTKPEVVAPGVGITAPTFADLKGNCVRDCCAKYYAKDNGTSLAAPHVTGLIALMFQRKSNLTNAQIRNILTATAVALPGPNLPRPNPSWGWGRIDGVAALAELDRQFPPPPPPPPPPSRSGLAATVTAARGLGPTPLAADQGILRTAFADQVGGRLDDPVAARWAALVSLYFSEVRGLISHRRRVALYWHRLGGPELVRGITHEFGGDLAAPRPPAPDASRFAGYLDRFLDELDRLGSAGLRREVRRHRALLGSATPQTLLSVLADGAPTDTAR